MKNGLPSTLKEIKEEALKNYTYDPLFIWVKNKEALVLPRKYSRSWWHKATLRDIKKVAVF